LGRLLADARYEVRCLVTTIDATREESSVHGLPTHLLRAQADAAGLPLLTVALSGPGLDDYVEVMNTATRELHRDGIRAFAFGDLEHSGALAYREDQFTPHGVEMVEPLWGMTSDQCMAEYLGSGIQSITVVVDASLLGRDHLGVPVDEAFIDALPANCDPCGETGEYHTFVWNAPYFRSPVGFTTGRTEYLEHRIGTQDGVKEFTYWRMHLHRETHPS